MILTDMCILYSDAIIKEFNKQNEGVLKYEYALTNTRLQKLLFYVYVEYARKHDKPLFKDVFTAVKRGPVIIDVYNKYSVYQFGYMSPFTENEKIDKIDSEIKDIIKKVIEKTHDFATEDLVEKTHIKGSPWATVYEEDKKNKISFESIKEYYTNKENYEKLYERKSE